MNIVSDIEICQTRTVPAFTPAAIAPATVHAPVAELRPSIVKIPTPPVPAAPAHKAKSPALRKANVASRSVPAAKTGELAADGAPGEGLSINALLVEHLPRLRAYAMMLTRNRASADDLVQETAYRVLRSQCQFTIGTNFTAWVYRILRNQFISSIRRSKRALVQIDELPESLLEKRADQDSTIFTQQVVAAMDKLHPEQREVLILICAAGMSYDEAAETLKCSIGTIKSRLWRARKHMELLILEDESDRSTVAA
jgi:RNA polymerase sigma-70 factor (ECF subfamily)